MQAKQYYLSGMKIKEIAEKLGKSSATIRSWKSRYKWDDDSVATPKKNVATKRNKNATQHENVATQNATEKAIDDLDSSELTDRQKAFVVEYVKSFNATQSYINVYGVDYNTAQVAGPRLLGNVRVSSEIERLRKARLHDVGVTRNDIVSELAKQAFANVGDYLEFGQHDEFAVDKKGKQLLDADGNPIMLHRSWVQLKDKSQVDTSLIKKVSIGRDGVVLDLYDKQSAQAKLLELLEAEEVDHGNPLNNISDEALKIMLNKLSD